MQANMKIKKHKIDIPIYFGRLDIIICKDLEHAYGKLKYKTDGYQVGNYSAFVYTYRTKKGYSRYAIFLKPRNSASVLAHECLHVTHRILAESGIQSDFNNDEAEAYLMGWVFDKVYSALRKRRKH